MSYAEFSTMTAYGSMDFEKWFLSKENLRQDHCKAFVRFKSFLCVYFDFRVSTASILSDRISITCRETATEVFVPAG